MKIMKHYGLFCRLDDRDYFMTGSEIQRHLHADLNTLKSNMMSFLTNGNVKDVIAIRYRVDTLWTIIL